LFVSALALMSGCAKTTSITKNEINKRFLEAWLSLNYPDAQETDAGIYILEDHPGEGKELGTYEDNNFVYLEYTSKDIDGNIEKTTYAKVAQQIGTYDAANYYGPVVKNRYTTALTAGLESSIATLRVGGTRTVLIPGWLNTYNRYSTVAGYFKNESGSDAIYEISIKDAFSDITQWQVDSVESYINHNLKQVDSLKYGFYYIQTKAPTDTTSFEEDDELYITYVGSLLNGHVFDTDIEKVAKDAGIYDSSTTYGSHKITFAEEYSEIEMTTGSTSGSVVDGFAYCLSLMKTGEKGTCIFISDLGYSSDSSNESIPAYSPLRFDIEMLGKQE